MSPLYAKGIISPKNVKTNIVLNTVYSVQVT